MAAALSPDGSSSGRFKYERLVQPMRTHDAEKTWTRDDIVELLKKNPVDGLAGKSVDSALRRATQRKLLTSTQDGGLSVNTVSPSK